MSPSMDGRRMTHFLERVDQPSFILNLVHNEISDQPPICLRRSQRLNHTLGRGLFKQIMSMISYRVCTDIKALGNLFRTHSHLNTLENLSLATGKLFIACLWYILHDFPDGICILPVNG